MEDMIKMLLDVVRTQHSATEGTDEKPFDMDDVVDMAMNIMGRPEGDEAMQDMVTTISQMVESMAPDIFPPKTFEQMDDKERYASAANMIEASLMRGPRKSNDSAPARAQAAASAYSMNPDDYTYGNGSAMDDSEDDDYDPKQAADLNDVIYNNFMQMMGLNEPKLEFPFDRSQIRYGKEKTFAEMAAEEEEELRKEANKRPLSAWELAQNAIDEDDAAHAKEPYIPQVLEEPKNKSASQLAAEAIKRAEEQDRMQMEVERRAARMMEEAKKRGKDPMAFALHQQEILRYMEKNSDELVSFEDYEDLSPEEKYELEKQFHIDKQIEEGVDPDKVDTNVPEEYIPIEFAERIEEQRRKAEEIAMLTGSSPIVGSAPSGSDQVSTAQRVTAPTFTPEMLRALSEEVLRENSDMILAENEDEDLEGLNELIFNNIQQMMAGSGAAVEQENVEDLINQVIASNRESQIGEAASANVDRASDKTESAVQAANAASSAGGNKDMLESLAKAMSGSPAIKGEKPAGGLSAVELARAAQAAAKPEPKVVVEKKSAVELAKAALLESEKAKAQATAGLGGGAPASVEAEQEKDPVDDLPELREIDQAEIEAARKKEQLDREMARLESKLKSNAELSEEDAIAALKASLALGTTENDDLDLSSLSLDDLGMDDLFDEEEEPETRKDLAKASTVESKEKKADAQESSSQEISADAVQKEAVAEAEEATEETTVEDSTIEETAEETMAEDEALEEAEDPDALVLGEHTQEEIDEALENLMTLGLEGEVYERAKRMLLLELAGSEEVLDAWLAEEEKKKKRQAAPILQDEELDELDDIDELELERELESAIEADFGEKTETNKANGQAAGSEAEAGDQATDSEEADADGEAAGSGEAETDGEEADADGEAAGSEEAEVDGQAETDSEEADADGEAAGSGEVEVDGEAETDSEEAVTVCEEEESETVEASGLGAVKQGSKSDKKASEDTKKSDAKKKVKRAQKGPQKSESISAGTDSKEYGVSVRKPFSFKSSAVYMDKFEEYITDTQENRKLTTGFKKLDAMLRYGLHKGSYFIDSEPQYLKNRFMQQMADRAAESGVDVLYISTELARYDLMLDTISRLSYEMNGKNADKAVSVMDIMTGENGADIHSLKDELNWYRGRVSEHLFLIDQEAVDEFVDSMEETNPAIILEELIRSIVREGTSKPVVFIDNLENVLYDASYDAMRLLMEGMKKLAKELGIPILMSYGYTQVESEAELYPEEKEFHEYLGNLCDVYLELKYADMITDDSREISAEDIRDMMEEGETLLIDVLIHRNRRSMKASCQIQGTPKFNFFEE